MIPKKTKFRKFRKIRLRKVATSCNSVSFGSYGIKVNESIKVTAKQIEAVRKVVSRTLKRNGVLYIRIFPHLPVTKKPLAVRMGGGKGGVDTWIAQAPAGTIILEIDNVTKDMAIDALNRAKYKLSVDCSIVERKFAFLR